MGETDLKLSGVGFPPWSARGCVQILEPIVQGELRRTVNGQLVYVGLRSHQKYCSVIKCQDKKPLALENIWQGDDVWVSCIQPLTQRITGSSCLLNRDPVEGSITAMNQEGQEVKVASVTQRKVELESQVADGFVSYRPYLHMCVSSFGYETDEWGIKRGWFLKLEEI